MASIGYIAPQSPPQNVLFNLAGADQAAQQVAAGNVAIQAGQQQLQDAQTLKDLAPALAAGDPNAMAQAAVTDPAKGTAALNSLMNVQAAQRQRAQYGAGVAANVAGSVSALPADQQSDAYDALRGHAIAAGMDPAMLPQSFPGTGSLLAIRNSAIPVGEQVNLNANYPRSDGAGPMGSPVGGGTAPAAAAPGSFVDALQRAEGPRPNAINAQGYVGNFQFGESRLKDLGVYQPAQGENVSTTATIQNPYTWQGTFSIPGFPQVKTIGDFLSNPAAQQAVVGEHIADLNQDIAQTPGTQGMSQWGLLGVGHLGGPGAIPKFVAGMTGQGPVYNPGDNPNAPGGGTHLSDYYNRFALMQQRAQQAGHSIGPSTAAPGVAAPAAMAGTASAQSPFDTAGYAPQGGQAAPVQVASAANSTGMPQVATDAVPISGVGGGQDAGLPAPTAATLARLRSGAPVAGAGNVVGQNALAGIMGGASPPPQQPNALASLGTSSPFDPSSPGGSSAPPAAVQSATAAAGLPPGARILTKMGTPLAVDGEPGQVQAVMPDGTRFAYTIPGARDPRRTQIVNTNNGQILQVGPDGDVRSTIAAATPGDIAAQQAAAKAGVQLQTAAPIAGAVAGAQAAARAGVQLQTAGPIAGAQAGAAEAARAGVQLQTAGPIAGSVAGAQAAAKAGVQLATGGQIAAQQTAATQSTGEPYKLFNADYAQTPALTQQAQALEQQISKTLEARNMAQGLPTGSGGEERAALANWMSTYAPAPVTKLLQGSGFIPDPVQAQQAAKLMLSQAGQDEKAMGGSGGLGLTEMYAKANPNLNMQPQAIQQISNLKAVAAMASRDYIQGKLAFINGQAPNLQPGGSGRYAPATQFDSQWLSKPNVQTYMAAVNAMNGEPFQQWSKNLNTSNSDQVRSVVGIINRIDPSAASSVAGAIPGARTEAGVVGQAAPGAASPTPLGQVLAPSSSPAAAPAVAGAAAASTPLGQVIAPPSAPAVQPVQAPSAVDQFLRRPPAPAAPVTPQPSSLNSIVNPAASSLGAASQAPVRVSTPQQAMTLPHGTPIILPDGSMGRVP